MQEYDVKYSQSDQIRAPYNVTITIIHANKNKKKFNEAICFLRLDNS